MKIYVAGHLGLVGSALVRKIEEQREFNWIGQSREQLDLLNLNDVETYLNFEKPDVVVLAAAKVGGIKANNDFPVEFLNENLQIQNNVINSAFKAGVDKLIFLASSCIYPKFSPQPIKEEYLLTGALEPTNETFAIAKIAGIKLIQAYRREYKKNWISVMPTNIYGPNDNFDLTSSHVLPALIRKIYEAKISDKNSVELWGTGTVMREFLFVDDLAEGLLFLLDKFNGPEAINIGSSEEISISELANKISQIVGFNGKVIWNHDMPDGTPRKFLDSSKINSLGWVASTTLDDGIKKTFEWYLSHVANR